jgi:hypothetical protein
MLINHFYSLLVSYGHSFYNFILNFFYHLEFRDYITALSLGLGLWNFWDSRQKFAALNYPILKVELELAPYGSFPIYPNYKVTNISDKKSVDIHIIVKIACLGHKWQFWKNQWIERTSAKFDNLESGQILQFQYYQKEHIDFRLKNADGKTPNGYLKQKFRENQPINAFVTVSYKPLAFKAKTLKSSKYYKLILRRSLKENFIKEDFIMVMPILFKLEEELCLSLLNQLFVYRSLLPKLELSEMIRYRTHYWELQEVEQGWQQPFKRAYPSSTWQS